MSIFHINNNIIIKYTYIACILCCIDIFLSLIFYYNELSYLELRLATLVAYACSNNTLPLSVGRGGSSTGML